MKKLKQVDWRFWAETVTDVLFIAIWFVIPVLVLHYVYTTPPTYGWLPTTPPNVAYAGKPVSVNVYYFGPKQNMIKCTLTVTNKTSTVWSTELYGLSPLAHNFTITKEGIYYFKLECTDGLGSELWIAKLIKVITPPEGNNTIQGQNDT